LVGGWGSDESTGRLEMLLTTPLARSWWAIAGGLGVLGAIAAMTALAVVGVGIGSVITGGDALTPIGGTVVLGLYAACVAGVGLAVGGLFRSSLAGEAVAILVTLTFLVDLVGPALRLPTWVQELALSSHMGQPMLGHWDWFGITACLVLAVGGLAVSGWGMSRRDVAT
jgi:ABC-2 type transport system permease protein